MHTNRNVRGNVTESQPLHGRRISQEVLLDNVQCVGNEMSLLDCSRNSIREHNCDQSDGAGVRCGGVCTMIKLVDCCNM